MCHTISIYRIVDKSFTISNETTMKEEEIVEEFGKSMFSEATGIYYSMVGNTIDELIELKNESTI